MKKIAIDKASERLNQAREAFRKLKTVNSYSDFSPIWFDLLVALSSIYAILETGAGKAGIKGNKSAPWFGRKKHDRTADSLLAYMHQARNVEEHGIEPVTEYVPGYINIGINGERGGVRNLRSNNGELTFELVASPSGKLPTVVISDPAVILVSVTDHRYGTTFDPPTTHLGLLLTNISPLAVAEKALAYHVNLVEEAARFVV